MTESGPTQASSTRNLKRLFALRSLLIAGGLAVLLTLHFALSIALPLGPLLLIIGLLCLLNLWTWRLVRKERHIRDSEFFLQLTIDVMALASVLYFTGGATNPFAWFFLIPLVITATVLSPAATWLMAALTTACYTLLLFFFLPLGDSGHMQHSKDFTQHVFGMWFGFVLSAALIAWFVVGMANTLKRRDLLLAQAREQTLRDERLVALGTLATGAAHELGTPLATMAIIAKELERAAIPEPAKRKVRILRDQVDRCKQALSIISASAGEARAESGGLVAVGDFLDQVIDAWRRQRVDPDMETSINAGDREALIVNEYTLHQSLINLLNNAADASAAPLLLRADWNPTQLNIDILDRGPGLHPGARSQMGSQQNSDKEYGMGLGLFLTHATVQRLGGRISLLDREDGGTCTRIQLPLAQRP